MAANATDNDDNIVEIPAGMTFSSMPIALSDISNIEFVVDGTLLMSKRFKEYQP